MKKSMLFILIFVCMLLTSCSGEYNLTVKDTKLNEQITMNIYPSDHIPRQYENDKIDMASEFLEDEYYSFFDSYNKMYKKKIVHYSGYDKIILNYKFNINNFEKSYYINNCFSKQNIVNKGKYYTIELGGYFSCLYGEKLDIKVKSYNKVLYNNADTVDGRIYIWHINKNNYKDINILIKMDKKSVLTNILIYCAVIVTLLLIPLVIFVFIKKQNNRNKI